MKTILKDLINNKVLLYTIVKYIQYPGKEYEKEWMHTYIYIYMYVQVSHLAVQ